MGDPESLPFGEVLRRYRLDAGLSQERLAERTGLSVRGVSDLERGARRTPRLETLGRLADGLELDPAGRAALVRAARGTVPASSSSPPATLPTPPTPLLGRDHELAHLVDRIRDPATRLLTLTGPGGVGKSRLAIEVASMSAPSFAHGAHLIELAPLRDPGLVVQAIAHTLGVIPGGGTPLPAALDRFLRDRRLLLLLDNVEHLLPAVPDIADLLAANRGLTVLATSRGPLSIRAEHLHAVHPLDTPAGADAASAAAVAASPGGRLFVARVRQVHPGFALRDDDAPVVAAICQQLDGLPLALELAAAHVRTLPPAALLARLERRLPMLTRGQRDLPERHRALDATIAWSDNLLEPDQRRLFRRLAVFARGWTLGAAEAVAGGDPAAFDTLFALVNASLVMPVETGGDEPRFTMLETIREYAADQLRQSGEEASARAAHAAWVLDLVERGGPELVGPHQQRWIARFDDERDNLRAALGWALDRKDAELALRLAAASWQYWLARGHATEGRHWLDRVLALAGDTPSPVLGAAQFAAGTLAAAQDDYTSAEPLLERSVDALRAAGEPGPLARTLQTLGIIALNRGDPARAVPLLERAIATYEPPVHPFFAPWYALAHSQLAGAVSSLGDRSRAATLAARGMALQREIGSELGLAISLLYHGDIALDRGDATAAARTYRESIATLARLGDRWYALTVLTCWLSAAADGLPPRVAARLLGANATIREQVATPVWPRYAGPLAGAEARVRSRLGEAAFGRARQAGAALDLDAAIAEVLAIDDAADTP